VQVGGFDAVLLSKQREANEADAEADDVKYPAPQSHSTGLYLPNRALAFFPYSPPHL